MSFINTVGGGGGDDKYKKMLLKEGTELDDDELTYLPDYCFYCNFKNYTKISFKNVVEVGSYCFASHGGVNITSNISFPSLETANENSFMGLIGHVNFPSLKYANGFGTFTTSIYLKSISFENLEEINGRLTFNGCRNLSIINLTSKITKINKEAFSMSSLTTINIDRKKDSILGAPWGAPSTCTVNWTGTN